MADEKMDRKVASFTIPENLTDTEIITLHLLHQVMATAEAQGLLSGERKRIVSYFSDRYGN